MRICVTGANGFLGSNFIRSLLKNGHDVLGISRDSNNIEDIYNQILFIKQNENNYSSHHSKILKFCPDVVVHFAWHGGNNYSDINSLSQFSINLPMTASLLQIFKNNQKPYFIGLGSFSEYGNLTSKVFETQIDDPQSYYGLAKSHAKTMSKMFCEKNGMRWSWVRPCYVYGPNDVSTRLIPSLITKLKTQNTVELNSCNSVVDYIYIDDFTKGVTSILQNNIFGVYNVCSGEEYNVKDIVLEIEKKLNYKNKVIFNKTLDRYDFPQYICGSNKKLKDNTLWFPKTNLSDGLDMTIKYFLQNI
jgi:nucleoside-diphosphate-sugar epimerase